MRHESVQEMFSRVAADAGTRAAVERGGRRLTYAQLEAESKRLANFLIEGGVGRGTMVGLFTDDPLQVITGILGVLRAGGVFVPLDPTFPDGRLQVMNAQVSPAWYVADARHLGKLRRVREGAGEGARVVCPDAEPDELRAAAGEHAGGGLEISEGYGSYNNVDAPGVKSDPEAPCSVYFTSGSTGRPKAILGRLKGIDHYVRWEIEALGVGAGTRVTQLASPSFDGFLKDAFVPLCAGGVACAPESRGLILDAGRLVDWLDIEQIEILHCVPSVFRALINQGLNSNYFEAMRYVALAGEALMPSDVRRWMEVFGERIKLVNLYGPTETTILKVFHFVQPEDVARPSIPLGKPIKGAAVLIMDSALQPCHEGAVGEIYIRTPYCSHGYYKEPELTREVFLQNPFNDDPSDIIHKTGDYGRLLEDGSLEFLGRRDQQVKVRGVRVELGEIENLLRGHEDVADVAVIDRDDAEGNKFLVAYVTLSNGTRAEDLRPYLSERLPEAMMPSAFVEMEKLPRTLNGKVDRKALPALETVQAEHGVEEFTPRNPVEEIVAGIWREVLRLPSVGLRSNFFNLGGHSLLATQVILRVRNALQVELPVRSMFEAPTVEQFSQLIQARVNDGGQSAPVPIEPAPRDGELPLSFAQQRMWFQEEITPGVTAFHIPLAVRLRGALNVAALEQTFGEVVRRHENLRTSFPLRDGQPVQHISPPSGLSMPLVDLSRLPEGAREEAARRAADAAFALPFDVQAGPLARVLLIRHADDEHSVFCTLHHLVSDGWSKGVLVKEISTLYAAFAQAEPSPLPELAIQYADFAAWERRRLQGEGLEQELSYWKRRLAGAPPLLQLATDRPRPPAQTYRGAAAPLAIPPQLTERLKALSLKHGATHFMTLMAAFMAMLHRYTSQEDVVVGATVANRERSDIEGLIGFFVNMVALRGDCSGNPRFKELLRQVRESTFQAYAHQGAPFDKLVQELRPARNPAYPPLFQVAFGFQNQPNLTEFALPGLTVSFPAAEVTSSQFDLLLDLSDTPDGLAGALIYNTDLFDRETAERMAEHFRNLLEGVASDPERRLSELPLLGGREREESVVAWNRTEADYPRGVCAHELFEARADAEPDAVAATCGGAALTYGELDRKADRLARRLRAEGVGTGSLVGVCLEHSLEEVVAVLGALKAGAGYVPLDPGHPARRISFIVADAGVSVVLTQRKYAEMLSACGARPLSLDEGDDDAAPSPEDGERVASGASPGGVAYVIYTSGSTGEPKGVRIAHESLVNYVWWAKDAYLRGERLNFALYSSLAFDLTVTSLFVPLVTGNQVAVYGWEGREPPLERVLGDGRTGVLKLTPSHLALIKDRDNSGSGVRRLIVGGEALGAELARRVHESFGGRVEIYNEYGPTEATVGCMLYRFDPERDQRAGVPIGRPAPNTRLYVLDEWMEPAATGVPGELYIAGAGLALGYLNRPALTAERFVADPFSGEPGARLYRTGDLCRRLPSGDLEYLGRRDEQVKFHGYRVELGEIQLALRKHPQVSDCAVVVAKDGRGHDLMAAYYVSGEALDASELRGFLAELLIAETVPNVFVHLDALPLTLNGKVDYDALPPLDEARRRQRRDYEPPRTPQEEAVAAIWAEVLSLDRVGVYENFFALGGHSLLALQVIHRVNQTFMVELPMRVIFDYPTVAELSLLIEETIIERLEAAPEAAPSGPEPPRPPAPPIEVIPINDRRKGRV
ncbi:MAG TPA: amino acid adenylation domain-containing protein [Pyrinomonadaceae bacterium]|jgi:amino acid adenylation domain-containing protein